MAELFLPGRANSQPSFTISKEVEKWILAINRAYVWALVLIGAVDVDADPSHAPDWQLPMPHSAAVLPHLE